MNRRIGFATLVLGVALVLSGANSASACFGMLGGGCGSGCGCDDGCGRRCCLLGLFHRHNDCCCEETCYAEEASCCAEEASCAAEPSCGAAAEPSCGAEASSGCEDSCCDPC